ncbi:PaaI family thioesterase [Alkalihalobacterium chitinilyticum]|uniref:PaaI family thioesterase n=1 Tax=Alkalihalobacterium chitinilyticum TaxID=2980103 RepID=A0ABT5VCB4_9BACI|nr:PaaI family thioesterase [Alkalihalobacterium chitinilyticum]MDE5413093.1 PaaI family thioesterase [Alkalihalobacterium chitinilyticum]
MEENQLLAEIQTIIETGSEDDRNVLKSVVQGIRTKQRGEHRTYLSAITHVNHRFVDDGTFEVTIPIQPLIENPLKMAHGGITATLLDTAMGSMLNLKAPQNIAYVTAELKVNYIHPGRGKHLRCIATILHQGKQLSFSEAKVYNDDDKLIATGSGTFFAIPLSS